MGRLPIGRFEPGKSRRFPEFLPGRPLRGAEFRGETDGRPRPLQIHARQGVSPAIPAGERGFLGDPDDLRGLHNRGEPLFGKIRGFFAPGDAGPRAFPVFPRGTARLASNSKRIPADERNVQLSGESRDRAHVAARNRGERDPIVRRVLHQFQRPNSVRTVCADPRGERGQRHEHSNQRCSLRALFNRE